MCILTEASQKLGQLKAGQGGISYEWAALDIFISEPLSCPYLELVLHSWRFHLTGAWGRDCVKFVSVPLVLRAWPTGGAQGTFAV